MHRMSVVLGIAWVPVLGGCMMMGGMHGVGAMGGDVDLGNGPVSTELRYAEAVSGDLSIALSFPSPTGDAPVPIGARLRTERDGRDLTDAHVRLWIRAPGGRIDQVDMRHARSSVAGIFEARYGFRAVGRYLLTAEGRTGTEGDIREVSVTAEAEVGPAADRGRPMWLMPGAFLGGLGMVALMAVMMGDGAP